MRWLFGFFLFCLTVAVVFFFYERWESEKKVFQARDDLRRLSALTALVFKRGRVPSEEGFWKEMGRAQQPLRDPWGNAYKLRHQRIQEKTVFLWCSAGADGRLDSKDDLLFVVTPEKEGDFSPEGIPLRGDVVRQAL